MLDSLRVELHRLLRYSFGGFFGVFIFWTLDHAEASRLTSDLGVVFGPLCTIVVGAAIYVVYRYIVGPLLLFPTAGALHCAISNLNCTCPFHRRSALASELRRNNPSADQVTEPLAHPEVPAPPTLSGKDWCERLKLGWTQTHDVERDFGHLRATQHSQRDRENTDLRHAEVGLLYIAGLEAISGVFFSSPFWAAYLGCGFALLIVAGMADVYVMRLEGWGLLRRPESTK